MEEKEEASGDETSASSQCLDDGHSEEGSVTVKEMKGDSLERIIDEQQANEDGDLSVKGAPPSAENEQKLDYSERIIDEQQAVGGDKLTGEENLGGESSPMIQSALSVAVEEFDELDPAVLQTLKEKVDEFLTPPEPAKKESNGPSGIFIPSVTTSSIQVLQESSDRLQVHKSRCVEEIGNLRRAIVLCDYDINKGDNSIETNEKLFQTEKMLQNLKQELFLLRLKGDFFPSQSANRSSLVVSGSGEICFCERGSGQFSGFLALKTQRTISELKKARALSRNSVLLEWKTDQRQEVVTGRAHELCEVLGAHLMEYNRRRMTYVKEAQLALRTMRTTVDVTIPEHEELLLSLWETLRPNVPCPGLKGEHWKDVGFQGTNPSTDFRGGGLLSLILLSLFAKKHRRSSVAMLSRSYPFACTSINICYLVLTKILGVSDDMLSESAGSTVWNSRVLDFFCSPFAFDQDEEDRPLSPFDGLDTPEGLRGKEVGGGFVLPPELSHPLEIPISLSDVRSFDWPCVSTIFDVLFILVDRAWVQLNAQYMEAPEVLNGCCRALLKRIHSKSMNKTSLYAWARSYTAKRRPNAP